MMMNLPALNEMGILTCNAGASMQVSYKAITFPRTSTCTPWEIHRKIGISAAEVDWTPQVEARYLFRWRVFNSTGSSKVARFKLALEVLAIPPSAHDKSAMKGLAQAIADSPDAPVFRAWVSPSHIKWIQVKS